MKQFPRNDIPADLEPVARRLEASRPALDSESGDRMVMRIVRRHRQEKTPLRTRIAIIAMLVLGLAFSGSGVGLAVSGSASQDTSAQGAYGQNNDNNDQGEDDNGVLGEEDSGGNDDSGTAGEEDSGTNPSDDNGTQTSRQQTVESGNTTSSSLPFTGFAAVPVMLIGVALLAGGLVLRRRTSTS